MTILDLPDSWRCAHTDNGHRCAQQAYYRGLCYAHRADAPEDLSYPRPRHSCSGCDPT